MSRAMMEKILGGFPNTGFGWDCVYFFKLENGVWEPYDWLGELIPGPGFVLTGKATEV